MKQKLFLKGILLLFALIVGGANVWADVEVKWVKVDPAALEAGDSIVIVDTTKCVAMANDPSAGSAPKATSVTLNTNKDQLDTSKGDIAKNLKWVVAIPETGKYQFKKDDTNYLFAKDNSDKDSLQVGAGTGEGEVNTFQLVKDQANNQADFLYAHMSDSKDYYVGVYSMFSIINTWVVRTSINADISSTVLTFFKRVESEKKDLEIKFEKDNYEFDLDGGGTFTSPIATTNPEGKTLTYSSSNTYVADVTKDGQVTVKRRGTVTITMRGDSIMRFAETSFGTGGSGGGNEGSEGSQGTGSSSNYNMAAFNCYSKDTLQDHLVKIYRFQYVPYFDITVGENGWRELVSAKNVKLPEGLTAYTAKEVADGRIYLEMVDQVKAEVPYVVLGSENTTYTLTTIEDVKAPEVNKFKISSKYTEDGVYVLDTEKAKAVFYKWDDALLGSGHVYLDEDIADESTKTLTICGFIGDANCDGKIDAADIVEIVNYKLDKPSDKFSFKAADVNMDGNVNDDDIEEIVKIIMGSE